MVFGIRENIKPTFSRGISIYNLGMLPSLWIEINFTCFGKNDPILLVNMVFGVYSPCSQLDMGYCCLLWPTYPTGQCAMAITVILMGIVFNRQILRKVNYPKFGIH